MSSPTATIMPPRHRQLEPAPGPTRLSSAGWARLRRLVTVAVFVTATVVGVTIGGRATDVSPVSPAIALAPPAAVAPAVVTPAEVTPAEVTPAAVTPAAAGPASPDGGQGRRGGTGGPGNGQGRGNR